MDNSSKVEITGNTELVSGENRIDINVISADGKVQNYKIIVNKEKAKIRLTNLDIENFTISPRV